MVGEIKGKSNEIVFRIDRFIEYSVTNERFSVMYKDRFKEGEFLNKIQYMYTGELVKIQFKFIESKIGDKAYITQQIDHMKKQVEGHHNEGNESKNGYKSIIVVSADYKNINDEKRAEFEKHLKEVGTELVVLDKMASEIDDKVRESI